MDDADEIEARIRDLTLKLEELRRSLPAHSVKPEMLMAIEGTEEEIEELRQRKQDLERGRA
ncbi:MAG: histidine kinase [Thermoplasmata archaeon]